MSATQPQLQAVPSTPAPVVAAQPMLGRYPRVEGAAILLGAGILWRYAVKPVGVWAVNKFQSRKAQPAQ